MRKSDIDYSAIIDELEHFNRQTLAMWLVLLDLSEKIDLDDMKRELKKRTDRDTSD